MNRMLHAILSKKVLYCGAAIAAVAIAAVSTTLIVRFPIAWPGAPGPAAVISNSANSATATPALSPAAELAATSATALDAAAAPPSLSKPALLRPTFDIVRVEPTGDAVIAGHAAPKAAIELRADGRVVAQASADASGDFTMLPPPFSAGDHHLELAARTGEAAAVLSDSVTINVPAPAMKASTSIAPGDALTGPSAAAASTGGSTSSKPDAVSAPAGAFGSLHPANTARVLMRTIHAIETERYRSLSAAVPSPEPMPEPEAEAPHRGGHGH